MLGQSDNQGGFFGDFLYNQVLSQDHYLRRLKALVEADRINEACRALYSDTGRPGWEPALLFRMLLLQAIHEIPSRDIEDQVNLNLAFKWFVGLDAHSKAPEASSLAAFQERLGPERFAEMMQVIVDKAREDGLLSEKAFVVDPGRIKLQGMAYRIKKDGARGEEGRGAPPRAGDWLDRASSYLRRLAGLFSKAKDPQGKLKF